MPQTEENIFLSSNYPQANIAKREQKKESQGIQLTNVQTSRGFSGPGNMRGLRFSSLCHQLGDPYCLIDATNI